MMMTMMSVVTSSVVTVTMISVDSDDECGGDDDECGDECGGGGRL